MTIILFRSFDGYLFVDRIMKAFSLGPLIKGFVFYGLEISFWELSASCSEMIGSADYKLNSYLLNSGSEFYKFEFIAGENLRKDFELEILDWLA